SLPPGAGRHAGYDGRPGAPPALPGHRLRGERMARFTTDFHETFTVRTPAEAARAYFGDLDRIAETLEEVERVERTSDQTLRVLMEPLSRGPVTFRGEYASRYYFPADDVLEWQPAGPGNVQMRGHARFTPMG